MKLTESQMTRIAAILEETEAAPVSQWEPQGGVIAIRSDGRLSQLHGYSKAAFVGVERNTVDACKLVVKRRHYNERLSALAHELGGEKEWIKGERNCYIYFVDGAPYGNYDNRHYSPEKVYMTEHCAIIICKMIESGEVIL